MKATQQDRDEIVAVCDQLFEIFDGRSCGVIMSALATSMREIIAYGDLPRETAIEIADAVYAGLLGAIKTHYDIGEPKGRA